MRSVATLAIALLATIVALPLGSARAGDANWLPKPARGQGEKCVADTDWMRRNLSSRVEAAVPIEDPRLQEYLWFILQSSLEDHRQAWEMLPDGRYRQRLPWSGSTTLQAGGVQNYFMQYTRMTAPSLGVGA